MKKERALLLPVFFLFCMGGSWIAAQESKEPQSGGGECSLSFIEYSDADFSTLGFPKDISAVTIELLSKDIRAEINLDLENVLAKGKNGSPVDVLSIVVNERSPNVVTELVGLGYGGVGTIGKTKCSFTPRSAPQGLIGIYLISGGFVTGLNQVVSIDEASLVAIVQGEVDQKAAIEKRGDAHDALCLVLGQLEDKKTGRNDPDSSTRYGVGVAVAEVKRGAGTAKYLKSFFELPANSSVRLTILLGCRKSDLASLVMLGKSIAIKK